MSIEAFSIERNQVCLEDDQGNAHIWSRAEFPHPELLVGVEKLSYEPRRQLFHIVMESAPTDVIVASTPMDHSLMETVHNLATTLEAEATAARLYVPPPTTQDTIEALEATVTPRKLRDALAGDAVALAFIADVEAQIALLR